MWLGTEKVFDAFHLRRPATDFGVMQVHAYPYDATGRLHRGDARLGLAAGRVHRRLVRAGESDTAAIAGDRGDLRRPADGSRCGQQLPLDQLRHVRCESWRAGNVVLLGDAAHTAHFSIGSGTEAGDGGRAGAAASLHEQSTVDERWPAYDAERRPVVVRPSERRRPAWSGSRTSAGTCTRSRAVSRSTCYPQPAGDAGQPAAARPRVRVHCGGAFSAGSRVAAGTPPMFHPYRLRGLELRNRVIVSPMDMLLGGRRRAADFHLVHLGSKALGGAGLVMTEMAVRLGGRPDHPGCAGLWTDEQEAAWARVVEFVHGSSGAAIGLQLGQLRPARARPS
jgi:anthraniloyl-CoA monooxygenase